MSASFDLMANLAECLCSQIREAGLPEPCFCGVLPGEAVYDVAGIGDCDDEDEGCGQAWVRLITAYPSKAVGSQDATIGNCGAGRGIDIELGIQRCLITAEGGESLTAEELLEATQLQMNDMDVLFKAVACCDALDPADFILGSYTPVGPQGGLLGGTLNIFVGL